METVHLVLGIARARDQPRRRRLGRGRLASPPAQRRLLVPAAGRPGRRSWSRSSVGAVLLLLGARPDGLHYVYGVLPLVVTLLAEAARAGAAERELDRARLRLAARRSASA